MRAALIAAAMLAGCAVRTPLPPVAVATEIQTVPAIVPVRCKPEIGPEPRYSTDAEFAAIPDTFTGANLYKADRLRRAARLRELEAALKACRGD